MIKCENCGYFYADVDNDGVPKSYARCHYVGPDAWTLCEQDEDDPNWEEMELIDASTT